MFSGRGRQLLFADADGASRFSDLDKLEASLTKIKTEVCVCQWTPMKLCENLYLWATHVWFYRNMVDVSVVFLRYKNTWTDLQSNSGQCLVFPHLSGIRVGLLVGCLTSMQHASVLQEWIRSDNCMCCHTEIEVADQAYCLTQSQYTNTGWTSPSADPITPGAWQGSHWSANF